MRLFCQVEKAQEVCRDTTNQLLELQTMQVIFPGGLQPLHKSGRGVLTDMPAYIDSNRNTMALLIGYIQHRRKGAKDPFCGDWNHGSKEEEDSNDCPSSDGSRRACMITRGTG